MIARPINLGSVQYKLSLDPKIDISHIINL